MRTACACLLACLLVLTSSVPVAVTAQGPTASAEAVSSPVDMPAPGNAMVAGGFVENRGQFYDGSVILYARWPGGGIAFLRDGVAITLVAPDEASALRRHAAAAPFARPLRPSEASDEAEVRGCTVTLTFEGARGVLPKGSGALPGELNYLIGNDPSAWCTGVRAFSEVVYEDLYEGIDLVYMATPQGVKYDLVLAAGADASSARVRVGGHTGLALSGGALVVSTPLGDLVDSAPVASYMDDDARAVGCAFTLSGDDLYGFALEGRDPSRAVVIDPIVYSTYFGGGGDDWVEDLCLDASGRVYVCGETDSGDFPVTAGVYQGRIAGWNDGFVNRFSADGTTLEMSTYLGGSEYTSLRSIAVDASGDIYVGGMTSSYDFPVTANAPQPEIGDGWENGVMVKLDSTGKDLDYSTFFGGEEYDYVIAIAVDDKGCLYATGGTGSYTMPVTSGAFQETFQEGAGDAFAVKLSAAGDEFVYSTYLGGTDDEEGHAIAVDDGGFAYISGYTYSSDFPTTSTAYAQRMPGYESAYVTKLAKDASSLVYSTYLGGGSSQTGEGIALDASGRAFVAGFTDSVDFPTTAGAYQTALKGDLEDLFVTHVSADGSSLVASSLLGGRDSEYGAAISLDPDGRPIVSGITFSTNFPTTKGAAQTGLKGDDDGLVSKLSADLVELEYSTYLGGASEDVAISVAALGSDHIWAAGMTDSTDLRVTADAYQSNNAGSFDGFIVRFILDLLPPVAVAGEDVTIDQHQSVELNASLSSDNTGIVNFTWSFRYNGSDVERYDPIVAFTFDEAGRYTVELAVRDVAQHVARDWLNVTVRDITPPVADAGPMSIISQHEWVLFDGSRSRDNVGIVNWTWAFTYRGEEVVFHLPGPMFLFDDAGNYTVGLNVSDAAGLWATDTVAVMVIDITPPVAEAGPEVTIGQHEAATLDGSGCSDNVGIVEWTWSFVHAGVPVTLQDPSPTFVFDVAGRYTVTLTVVDSMGLSATDTVTVVVLDTEPPVADAGADVEVDQGETVTFDGRGCRDNVGVSSFQWAFTYMDRQYSLEGRSPEFTFVTVGVYEVTLTVLDAEGNLATDTVSVTVRDVEDPVAEAGEDLYIDQHGQPALDGRRSLDNVGVVEWTWSLVHAGTTVTLSGPTPTVVLDDAGDYVVTMVVTDAAGNTATDALTVHVADTTPPVADAGPHPTIRQTEGVILDGAASTDNVGVTAWTWRFTYKGIPTHLNGKRQDFIFELPGVYDITLTVEDAQGNSNSTVLRVTVLDIIAPTIITPSRMTVKRGDPAVMDGSGCIDNVGVVRWVWTFRDGGRDVELEGASVRHTFKDKGDHVVTLTAYDAEGNFASETFTVTVETSMLLWTVVTIIAVVAVAVVVAAMVMRRKGRTRGQGQGG